MCDACAVDIELEVDIKSHMAMICYDDDCHQQHHYHSKQLKSSGHSIISNEEDANH